MLEFETTIIQYLEKKRRNILIKERRESGQKTAGHTQSHNKHTNFQTPVTHKSSMHNMSGRPSEKMAPAHAQFNKPTPMANQSNHRGAPYGDRSLSGRRMQNSIEVEEVDHIPYRQPFGAVKINRNSMRPSETQEKSCGKASPRSLVRHIAPEERSH